MPTTVSQNLIQLIHAFYIAESVDGPDSSMGFYATGQYLAIIPGKVESSISNPISSIVLPNGSKYDPHGTYAAPKVPGSVSFEVVLRARRDIEVSATDRNNLETEIMSVFAGWSTLIGYRGILYGAFGHYFSDTKQAEATARFTGLSANWGMPKQISTLFGGPGKTTRGIETATLKLSFDLLSNWTWEY